MVSGKTTDMTTCHDGTKIDEAIFKEVDKTVNEDFIIYYKQFNQ